MGENVKKSQNVEEKIHELEQELQIRIEDNAELYRQLCNFKNQLNEANEVIKKYMSVAFEIRSEEEKPTVIQFAFDYLEKWGVK